MASGGEDDDTDYPDGRNQRQVGGTDFTDQATYFMQSFIVERFESDHIPNAPTLRELRDGEEANDEEALTETWNQVGGTFRQIARSVDQSEQFQSVAATIPKDPSIEDIMCCVRETFSDGEINWGRIVALFCYAYTVCAKKFELYMEKKHPNFPKWLTKLITALVRFLLLKFADWIINRGGWQSIQEYFGTSDTIWKSLIVASLCMIAFSIWQLKK